MFVNISYFSIKKELKNKHKNAHTFTAYLVNLPLTNYLNRSTHFYNIRGLITYLYIKITNKQYKPLKTKDMITKDNLTQVLNLLTEKEINETMNAKSDYVGLWLTGYGHANLESVNMNDMEQIENIESTGGVICDKDNFLRLFEESESINPFLIAFL